jgi:hypothetical protein
MDLTESLRIDYANYQIDEMAPTLMQDGVSFLSNLFTEQLLSGSITLCNTRSWLQSSLINAYVTNDIRLDTRGMLDGLNEAYVNFLYIAFVDVVVINVSDFPELIELDALRINSLASRFHTDVISCIIVASVEEMSKHVCSEMAYFQLISDIQGIVLNNPPMRGMPSDTIRLVLQRVAHTLCDQNVQGIEHVIHKHLSKTSTIYRPISKILRDTWYYLTKGMLIPASCNLPPCARFLVPRIRNNTKMLKDIVDLNRHIHVTYYNTIIRQVTASVIVVSSGVVGESIDKNIR